MKRLLLLTMCACVPTLAYAQVPETRAAREGVVLPSTAPAAGALAVQSGTSGSGVDARPAMAGGVENADIGTKVMVRFESATGLNAADRAEFFTAKCGCYRSLSPLNQRYDADAPGPGPGAVTDANYSQFVLRAEYELSGRLAVVGELPFRTFAPQRFAAGSGTYANTSGLSDARAGFKFDMASDANSQITLQVLGSAPSGKAADALGTGHWSVEPAILYSTMLGDRASIETSFGSVIPLSSSKGVPVTSPDKFAGNVMTFAVAPSVDVYKKGHTRVAPVVELVGWRVISGYSTFEDGPANGTTILNINAGARVAFGTNSVYVGWGKAVSNATWYDKALRFELRHGL